MLITEAHRNFRFGMDKEASLNYPNYLPEEIDLLLNQAQDMYLKQRYGKNNLKRDSFEETEKRTEDLKEVIQSARLVGLTANEESIIYNSAMCQLPTNHWFTIYERAIINCTSCNSIVKRGTGAIGFNGGTNLLDGRYVEVRPVTHLEFNKINKDPFKGPNYDKILRIAYKNQAELIFPTDCTLVSYELRYLKQPVRVSLSGNVTFELSDHTHQEIINLAIQIALEGIEAKRGNSFEKIINTDE